MKNLLFALALAAASPVSASVTYTFESYAPGDTSTVVTSFAYTAGNFLTDAVDVPASGLDYCSSTAGTCGTQHFDRSGPNGPFNPGHDIIASEAGPLGVFHFFQYGAFSSVGTYLAGNPDIGTTAKLIVSESVAPVPEPGEWASLTAGLGIVGLLARRARQRA